MNPENLMNILEIENLSKHVIDFIFARKEGNYSFMRNENYTVGEIIELCEVYWNIKFDLNVYDHKKGLDKNNKAIWINPNNTKVVIASKELEFELSELWKRHSTEIEA